MRTSCDKSIRKSSSPDFPWCCIAAEGGFREIQLVQVRAPVADADGPQLGLTTVQVSRFDRPAVQRIRTNSLTNSASRSLTLHKIFRMGKNTSKREGQPAKPRGKAARRETNKTQKRRAQREDSKSQGDSSLSSSTSPRHLPHFRVSASHALCRWRADNTDGRRHERR